MNSQNKNKFPLKGIYFYLTDACNLKCQHCWISPKYNKAKSNKELNFDLFCKIIEEAKPLGLRFVRLTGGEPLLHSQIEEIIKHVAKNNLVLDIESNGTLITPKFANLLGSIKKKNISISLESTDPKKHYSFRGVSGSFKKTITGILNLKNAGVSPEIITCLSKNNKKQIKKLIYFAENLKLRSLSFKIINPLGRATKIFSQNNNLSIAELIQLGQWVEEQLIPKSKIPVAFGYPPAFSKMSSLCNPREISCNSCGIKGIMGVLSSGEYALCGIGQSIKELCFGNAKTNTLSKIWLNSKIINEIKIGLPKKLKGICAKCAMKELCKGACLAQNYYFKEDLWAPFWFCQQAYDLGLFPKSRIIPAS
ncbi:MAG: SynChlorMet cassette radical SAM/SPASM protein ScmF [Candidatus Saganbacteria bacterium]|nr:SynChlorMet cassette radical SAM/SPASM protein ScmF [Candidatus Saganbacteria bacterium]